jgi:hypothetical protein
MDVLTLSLELNYAFDDIYGFARLSFSWCPRAFTPEDAIIKDLNKNVFHA